MPQFAVGYLNLFDGELLLEEVTAKSKLDAMCEYLEIDPKVYQTEDSVHDYCSNCDIFIAALEL